MKRPYFLAYALILLLGWMQFYASVREQYNGVSEAQEKVKHLEEQAKNLKVERELEAEHFLEFRQYVATLMPDVLKEKGQGEAGYPFRNLASVVMKTENRQVKEAIAKTLFEQGKEYFRKEEYGKANRAFKQLIDRFGYTPYIPESYFLMSESFFLNNEFEESTKVIGQMVELFPSHELTGFAMIRLGRIYEAQNRNEEAVDIYKTVVRSFPQRDVASQAKSSLRGLDL